MTNIEQAISMLNQCLDEQLNAAVRVSQPMLTRGKRLADETEDWFRYGREWRCWSARPTDKQREEAPWDEITG